jgi:tetratricopeptide (TPR) repeat protein
MLHGGFGISTVWGQNPSSSTPSTAKLSAIRQRQPDRKEWRIADARRALEDLDRRAAMDPERRMRLRRADALNREIVAQYQQGKYAAAEMAAIEALRIRQEIQGERHPHSATSLNNLALLYQAMGDSARAEPLYRQASEIWKQALGERHPAYATSLNNLALLYYVTGERVRARQSLSESLEKTESFIRETASGWRPHGAGGA